MGICFSSEDLRKCLFPNGGSVQTIITDEQLDFVHHTFAKDKGLKFDFLRISGTIHCGTLTNTTNIRPFLPRPLQFNTLTVTLGVKLRNCEQLMGLSDSPMWLGPHPSLLAEAKCEDEGGREIEQRIPVDIVTVAPGTTVEWRNHFEMYFVTIQWREDLDANRVNPMANLMTHLQRCGAELSPTPTVNPVTQTAITPHLVNANYDSVLTGLKKITREFSQLRRTHPNEMEMATPGTRMFATMILSANKHSLKTVTMKRSNACDSEKIGRKTRRTD